MTGEWVLVEYRLILPKSDVAKQICDTTALLYINQWIISFWLQVNILSTV